MAVLEQQVPTGTWQADKIHSSIGFSVKHMVANFRGEFADYDATLDVAEGGDLKLTGNVRVASVNTKIADLTGHLQSPDFFDAERHPELRFESTAIRVEGDEVVVDGDLTIRGETKPVEARGTLSHVEADLAGGHRIGLELETVIDRTAYGLNWNAPLPKGGNALANDVTLRVHLELTPEA
jgi:polyisoprenoid-binding protein YceI